MRFESHAEERIFNRIPQAHDAAVDDTLEVAQAHARRYRRTGVFEGSLTRTESEEVGRDRREARIGSPLVSARIKERGGFIQARNGPYLTFVTPDGWRKVESVRIPATPVVAPAGGRYPQVMAARLREALR